MEEPLEKERKRPGIKNGNGSVWLISRGHSMRYQPTTTFIQEEGLEHKDPFHLIPFSTLPATHGEVILPSQKHFIDCICPSNLVNSLHA